MARLVIHAVSCQRSRSAASTGAVSGMHAAPEPERLRRLFDEHAQAVAGARAVRLGPGEERLRRRPVHHVQRQRSRRQHARRHRHGGLREAARRGVDDDVEGLAAIRRARAARSATPWAAASGACRSHQRPAPAPACGWRRSARAGRACSSGPSAPAAAPPAPISSTRRPASATRALRSMSRTRPMPSVLSASQPSASKRSVFAAPASAARSVHRAARRGASNLNGTRHVAAAPAARRQSAAPSARNRRAGTAGACSQLLPGGQRELRVDERRAAVLDRIADDGVAVHRGRRRALSALGTRRDRLQPLVAREAKARSDDELVGLAAHRAA